ncbi:MAG TPA: hypothetical protein VF516_47855 [Kofleriaceae bacterium]
MLAPTEQLTWERSTRAVAWRSRCEAGQLLGTRRRWTTFSGQTLAESVFQVIHGTPPRLTALVPGLPPEADEVVMTALAKDPRQRFAAAMAFCAAFTEAIGRTPEIGGDAPREPPTGSEP